MSRTAAKQRVEKIQHVIEIRRWRFDYYFGVNDLPGIDTAYLPGSPRDRNRGGDLRTG